MDARAYLGSESVVDCHDGSAFVHDPALLPRADAALFDPARGAAVAVGGRGSAWFVDTPAGPAVLRHYRRGGLAAKISRDGYLWQGAQRTRSFREFRLLQALRARALPVPTPLAGAYWRGGGGYRAALLTLRIAAAQSLGERLDTGAAVPWAAVGAAIAACHRAGACHADLNVDNVLLDSDDDGWLIDFDRGVLRRPALSWQRANLARLRRSLRKRLGARADAPAAVNGWEALLDAWNDGLREEA
ncbi:MAG: 3-deoxy-D-manno-octulosonic acid kinase [Proteobacteria bacterium]|nr:3-deoxy-D-manno-octulosonic acid kinase [Pseudomonadota bacterium]